MVTQLFKQIVPAENMFNLLDSLCVKNENFYIFNNVAFKRGMYNGSIMAFLETCKPCYHKSKQKYLNPPITYKSFVTVLRQICNVNSVEYVSKLFYDRSSYEIVYMIKHK
jgi:hypothetical protein